MVIQTTYTCTDPISFVFAPSPLHFRSEYALNPMKKHGRGYGKGKIRSNPIRLHPIPIYWR
jgi:hypothetical protein